jgi:hypothetical protein
MITPGVVNSPAMSTSMRTSHLDLLGSFGSSIRTVCSINLDAVPSVKPAGVRPNV